MKTPVVQGYKEFAVKQRHHGNPSLGVDDKEAQVLAHMLHDLSGPIVPDTVQRDAILAHVLQSGKTYTPSKFNLFISSIPAWMSEYPWRFAFGLSTVQAMICLLIFGADYPHWIQQIFMR